VYTLKSLWDSSTIPQYNFHPEMVSCPRVRLRYMVGYSAECGGLKHTYLKHEREICLIIKTRPFPSPGTDAGIEVKQQGLEQEIWGI
jgi:hypothetical protein